MKPESDQRKSPWKRRIAITFSILVILVGIACIVDLLARRQLSRAMSAARANGGPVTFQELMAARRQWPEDKNGANIILSIKSALVAIRDDTKANRLPVWGDSEDTPEFGRRWSDEADKEIREFLVKMQKELAAIDSLKGYEGGRFPITVDPNPANTLLPHLSPVRAACRLKHLQTLDRAMHNDTTHLVDDVGIMTKTSDLIVDEPNLIAMLVRVACGSLAISTVEEVCALTSVEAGTLRQLQDAVARLDEGNRRVVVGLRGERAFFIDLVDYGRSNGGISAVFSAASAGPNYTAADMLARLPGARGVLMQDEAVGIRLHNRLVAAAEQSRALPEARAIDAELPKLGIAVMTRTLFPSLTRAIILDTRLNAEARCAQVGLAAERFRIETGRFPARLDELVPKYIDRIPADPFLPIEPLKLSTQADRIIIYSVGEDGRDDAGHVRRDRKRSGGDNDVGFILLAPAARNQPPLPPATQPERNRRSAEWEATTQP